MLLIHVSYWSNWSGVTSKNGCSLAHPALLTNRSTGPMLFRLASVASQSARSTHTGVMDALWNGLPTPRHSSQRKAEVDKVIYLKWSEPFVYLLHQTVQVSLCACNCDDLCPAACQSQSCGPADPWRTKHAYYKYMSVAMQQVSLTHTTE